MISFLILITNEIVAFSLLAIIAKHGFPIRAWSFPKFTNIFSLREADPHMNIDGGLEQVLEKLKLEFLNASNR